MGTHRRPDPATPSDEPAVPAASVLLAGLELCAAGLHANGMVFRRQERQAARSDR